MNLSGDELQAAVAETAAVIRAGWTAAREGQVFNPTMAGIILGTGLGSLADHITAEATWSYHDLPHFARSTADGHRGRLLCGRLGDVPVVAMDGRFHDYEGYSPQQTTFPVRVMSALGARLLIASNASGGLNPSLYSGDILLIDDHVNLLWQRVEQVSNLPLMDTPVGNLPHEPMYDPHLLALTEQVAAAEQIALHRGTYVAMLGPNYETRAEYRWLRTLGDVVGMSTVPEVLVAREIGLPVIAFSMVANVFRPDDVQRTSSEEVIAAASNAEPKLRRLVTRLLQDWHQGVAPSVGHSCPTLPAFDQPRQ